jgi:hypothetical protein
MPRGRRLGLQGGAGPDRGQSLPTITAAAASRPHCGRIGLGSLTRVRAEAGRGRCRGKVGHSDRAGQDGQPPPAVGIYRFWRDTSYFAGGLIAGIAADAIDYSGAMAPIAALTAASGLWVMVDMPRARALGEPERVQLA